MDTFHICKQYCCAHMTMTKCSSLTVSLCFQLTFIHTKRKGLQNTNVLFKRPHEVLPDTLK